MSKRFKPGDLIRHESSIGRKQWLAIFLHYEADNLRDELAGRSPKMRIHLQWLNEIRENVRERYWSLVK